MQYLKALAGARFKQSSYASTTAYVQYNRMLSSLYVKLYKYELMKTCVSCEYLYNYDNIQDTNSTKQRNTSFGSTEILEEQESSNHVESTLSPCLKRKEWKNDWKNWDFKKNFNSSPKMNKK